MYPNAEWYNPVDTVILTFLSDHKMRIVVPSIVVSVNCGCSSRHASRRLKILEDAGLVEKPDPPGKDGYYRITNLGERAALGALDAEKVEEIEPSE